MCLCSLKYTFDGGSNGPFRGGKGSTWEGGSHVPAIVWMPGTIPAWSSCMSPITNMDILPTLADMIGFDLPTDRVYDGVSVLPYINAPNTCNDRENDPHEFTYYWRAGLLYAIRYRQNKAHWITRNGFGKEPPVHHNPPILFNIEWDVGESIELNTNNTAEYEDILSKMVEEYARITEEVYGDIAIPQINEHDTFLVPCCNKAFNYTEAIEFIDEGEIGLAIWDKCVCDYKPNETYPINTQFL